MADAYESVQRGGLKLKGVSDHGSKKKKKKHKDKKKLEEAVQKTDKEDLQETTEYVVSRPTKTKAELAYERAKRKKEEQLILEKASKSHKDRIMDFNQQLDNLTEHFDIPKVSWTK